MAGQATAVKPLAGVRIVELSTMITASLATMMLAAQGAEVIKIEPLGIGDPMRFIGSQKQGISALFANCNRGKRALAINLKDPAGQEMVQRLVAGSDVLIHNYRVGVMEKLNLGSERLRAANSKLIYVALTGFGKCGPRMPEPAYDHVIQALTGYTGVQANADGPQFVKTVVADKVTAYTACQAITAALLARTATGEGQHIDISMLQAALFFLWPDGMMNETLLADDVTQLVPMADYYQTSATSDGRISVAAATDEHWRGVAKVIERPDILEDPRFNSIIGRSANFGVLLHEVAGAYAGMTTKEALAALRTYDVPCGECLTPAGVIADEQVAAVGALGRQEHPLLGDLRTAMPPVQFEGEQGDIERPCPAHGEHSAEIARELGYSVAEVAALVEAETLSVP